MYARIDFQHNLMLANFERFFFDIGALKAFSRRQNLSAFNDNSRLPGVNIDRLSSAELGEYRRLLADLDQATLAYAGQLGRLRVAYGAILGGAQDEAAIVQAVADDFATGRIERPTVEQASRPGPAPMKSEQ
jgi:hypothetical protein